MNIFFFIISSSIYQFYLKMIRFTRKKTNRKKKKKSIRKNEKDLCVNLLIIKRLILSLKAKVLCQRRGTSRKFHNSTRAFEYFHTDKATLIIYLLQSRPPKTSDMETTLVKNLIKSINIYFFLVKILF